MTQDQLKSILSYDPNTGLFTRIKDVAYSQHKVGSVMGSLNDKGYRIIVINQKRYRAHRLAFLYMEGAFPPDDVDHRNTIKDDNRWVNLYKCTRSENMNNPLTYKRMQEYHNSAEGKLHKSRPRRAA
jgi:hypothetical protein